MDIYNNEPIDIIVPWVNPNDLLWQDDFSKYSSLDGGQKAACRFRDMGVFHFWFRCIEKNMPWVRYVFLVLSSPSQIPSWLNTDNPRLKIVYHSQFIPAEELPTFNSSVINCYMPFIPELSDNYILFNDDFFVVDALRAGDFFINNRPVGKFNRVVRMPRGKTPWYHNIRNNYKLVDRYIRGCQHIHPNHGPISFSKVYQLYIYTKMGPAIKSALHNSRFRKNKNVTDWLFFDIMALTGRIKERSGALTSFQYINKAHFKATRRIVCFNDNESFTDAQYNAFKDSVYSYLQQNFPQKSSFEL